MSMSVVVKRAVGFAPPFPFVSEATEMVNGRMVTARSGSYTEEGARASAVATLRERVSFAGFRRAVGFNPTSTLVAA